MNRWAGATRASVAVVLGLGAVAVLGIAGRTAPVSARLVGGNTPVDSARAADPLDTRASNSPTVVQNPKDRSQVVVVNRVDAPQLSCSLHVSGDGGSTWRDAPIPAAPGPATRTVGCFAPDAAFDAGGTLYVSYTSGGTAPDAVWVAASHDGGRTFGAPVAAGGPLAFQVRIAAGAGPAGPVFLTWLQAAGTSPWGLLGTTNPIVLSRSDDGGATWSAPRPISAPARSLVVAPTPVAAADGSLVVAYLDVGDDRLDYTGAHAGRGGDPYPGPWWLVVARSTDGAETWQEAVVDTLVPDHRFLQLFPPTPALAVHGSRAYVAFDDARSGDADVWLWMSDDGGARWGAPRRVNDTQQGDQYLPALAAAPDGRLDVVYYDRRGDPNGSMNEVSLQVSANHGRTFGSRIGLSDRAFDSRIGPGAERGMAELGSRLGVISLDGAVLGIWADTRDGNPATARQDLAVAVVAVSGGEPLGRGPLRAAGVALGAGGLAALGWAVGGRRDPDREPR